MARGEGTREHDRDLLAAQREKDQLEILDRDKARNDRARERRQFYLFIVVLVTVVGSLILFGVALYLGHAAAFAAVVIPVVGMFVAGLAIYFRRDFSFKAFGTTVSTTTATTTTPDGTTTTTTATETPSPPRDAADVSG